MGELLDAIRSLHLPEGRRAHDQSGSPDSFGRYTLGQVFRIALHMKGATRASICSPMSGDIGVDAGDPAQHVREQELVMVGEMPVVACQGYGTTGLP